MDTYATRVAAWSRRIRKLFLDVTARIRRKAFFCTALAGNSDVNLCVNSDLTVSCNCHDVDGTGQIGDLSRGSLHDILSGEVAASFRQQLAEGTLPIANCSRCCDLRAVSREQASRLAFEFRLPRFIMVENTVACNLRCVSCPRTQIRRLRSRISMSLDDVRRVAGELRDAGVQRVGYLNLGEPFLSPNIRRELEIFREIHPQVWLATSTNGVPLETDDKREAALLLDSLQFSLDGISQEMVNKYQRGTDFERARRNMRDLVAYRDARTRTRPEIIWKYLLFRWNDRRTYLNKAIELAREAGVDRLLFEKTVSPFYGLSWRSYLGWLNDIGDDSLGNRSVVLRASM